MSSFNQFGNVFQYGNIKNIDSVSGLHIGDIININDDVTNNNAETPTETPAETPDLHWDWDIDEKYPGDSFLWIAIMENPYAGEPHCYGASISFRGKKALALIERVRHKTGKAVTEEISKIWHEHK